MRCRKCGYVTFDQERECPKCGRRLPPPLVTSPLRPARRGGHPSARLLSPLTMSPVPRYFGRADDPEVTSLLEAPLPSPAASRADFPPEAFERTPVDVAAGPRPEAAAEDEAPAADLAWLDEPAGEADANGDVPRETDEAPPDAATAFGDADSGEDLSAALGGGEAEAERQALAAAPEEAGAPQPEEEALFGEELDLPGAPPSGEAQGVASGPEAGEASVFSEVPSGAGEEEVTEDLMALFDEVDGPAAPSEEQAAAAGAAAEPDADDLGPEEDLALAAGSEGDGGEPDLAAMPDDLDALLAEAGKGGGAAAAPAAAQAGEGTEEEDIDALWAEAFAEQEGGGQTEAAAQTEEAAEEAPAPEPQEASGEEPEDDDIASMWDVAFAEQEASRKVQQEGGEPEPAPAPPKRAKTGEPGEEELEKMWEEALAGGEAVLDAPLEAPQETAPDEASEDIFGDPDGEESDGLLAQDDLDALLSSADAKGPSEEAPQAGEPAAEQDAAAAAPPPDPFGEDDEEIEAFIPEAAPEPDEAEREDEPAATMSVTLDVSLSQRVLAGLLDFGIVGAISGLFAAGTHWIVSERAGPIFSNMEALAVVTALDLMTIFLLSLFYSVYFIGAFGYTPGHRSFGLSVVGVDERPAGYMQAVLRYFGGLAATLPLGLGHILVFFDKRRRGLGDRIAGTRVVLRRAV